ncbi:MAG: WYL domain-containing protein [Nitrospirae bacterium]|nr:WYL domain-containing protein [Nitrospirota bacterium]
MASAVHKVLGIISELATKGETSLDELIDTVGITEQNAYRLLKDVNEYFEEFYGKPLIKSKRVDEAISWSLQEDILLTSRPNKLMSVYMASIFMTSFKGTDVDNCILDVREHIENQLTRKMPEIRNSDRKFHYRAFGRKYYEKYNDQLCAVLHGLIKQKKVEILYKSQNYGEKNYLIHPYTLFLHKETLYIIAYSETDIKKIITFGIDRIISAKTTDNNFKYPKDYSPDKYTDKSFGMFHGKQEIKVTLEFNESLYEYITSREWSPSQQFTNLNKGKFQMSVFVSDFFEIMRWTMQFGSDVKVIEPIELRNMIEKEAEKVLGLYKIVL